MDEADAYAQETAVDSASPEEAERIRVVCALEDVEALH